MTEAKRIEIPTFSRDAVLFNWIYHYIQEKGLTFPREIVASYYISLKTKPFVILTGVSGTGKTQLTKLFADALTGENTGHYILVPVAPDWTDNSALTGYYNVVQERRVDTEFSQYYTLAKDLSQEPFFVCLDEMNLAKVEHYFSQFLSHMEIGKVPPNLFITGTVNMDESTYQFSKKVLDRANTLEFNEVYIKQRPSVTQISREFNYQERKIFYDTFLGCQDKEWDEEVINVLETINSILVRRNMQFAYRVRDEVLKFIANSRGLLDKTVAIDLQILQKVMPRVGGTKEQVEQLLVQLLCFFLGADKEALPSEIEDLYLIDAGQYPACLYPRSAKKTARMLGRVREDGFVNFYE